ncbi:DUF418 domain-containing protein [Sphingomonas sanxanigenens]|uniref:DUF418 domain-containing protein n=1 Tax=Sphingomonas sanxanigenens TaxID=397260 RepID=UPI0005879E69|nr:DUF418 domain-containing protein [Sphingomonas sanxanigenens]
MSAVRGDRLIVVDVIRGFALMALFLVHMMESYELYWAAPREDAIIHGIFLLFMGKSFSLLALCFGFGFFALMRGAAARGVDFSGRFIWRLIVLAAIGSLHALIYRGDIIQLLALLGLMLPLFHRVKSNQVIVAIAAAFLLQPVLWVQFAAIFLGGGPGEAAGAALAGGDPAMPIYLHGNFGAVLRENLVDGQIAKWAFLLHSGRILQIAGLYLVGMVLGRIDFFGRLSANGRARRIALVAAVVAALATHFAVAAMSHAAVPQFLSDDGYRLLSVIVGGWFDLAVTAIWVLLLCELWLSRAAVLLIPLASVGRATLSLYILQSLIFVPLFYPFGLGVYDDWDSVTRLWVGLCGIAAQLVVARLWFARFRYGPIEWAWRSLTYLRTDIPLRTTQSRAG